MTCHPLTGGLGLTYCHPTYISLYTEFLTLSQVAFYPERFYQFHFTCEQ